METLRSRLLYNTTPAAFWLCLLDHFIVLISSCPSCLLSSYLFFLSYI
jgi:hypothetical protein